MRLRLALAALMLVPAASGWAAGLFGMLEIGTPNPESIPKWIDVQARIQAENLLGKCQQGGCTGKQASWYDMLRDVQGAYGLMIDGESMVPEYWPGDVAWINPHLRPARGKNHIFYHTPPDGREAEAIVKRLNDWNDREWHLEQWNPHRQFNEFRREWPIAHRVVGKYDAD